MSAESAVAAGRTAAEALMVDTCKITKLTAGSGTFNESTGQYDGQTRVTLYEGKCRLQSRGDSTSGSPRDQSAGEHQWTTTGHVLQLPVDGTEDVVPDARVEYLTSALDPMLAGRMFHLVAEAERKSHATKRRFRVIEVVN